MACVSTLVMNALPITAGTFVFAEAMPQGPFGGARLLAFVAVVAGAALLARAEPQSLSAEAAALTS